MTEPTAYKIRPTRAQMQQFPAFNGLELSDIQLLTEPEQVALARADLCQCDYVGFDTESKPTFQVGEHSTGPHLVQLASNKRGYLFTLNDAASNQLLVDILSSEQIVKVGFGLKSDRGPLQRKLGIEVAGLYELSNRVKQLGYQHPVGLQAAVAILLGQYLVKSKRVALSNWSNPELTSGQLRYAANDAYASLRVFQALAALAKSNSSTPSCDNHPSAS
ncbi:3'-5' exonuclease [Oceanisphaera sp. IT1-181]|uniref:3'-5' exonuclease n=1 Tax=Oceanisphaera sp. IT1-181 TaxID=3081199 RepID=UPI0029CA60FA|nr:3'-5' exonuclease [Oceanisphaera sp. IT1-181]